MTFYFKYSNTDYYELSRLSSPPHKPLFGMIGINSGCAKSNMKGKPVLTPAVVHTAFSFHIGRQIPQHDHIPLNECRFIVRLSP